MCVFFFWFPQVLCKLSACAQLSHLGTASSQLPGGSALSLVQKLKKWSKTRNNFYWLCVEAAQAHLHVSLAHHFQGSGNKTELLLQEWAHQGDETAQLSSWGSDSPKSFLA